MYENELKIILSLIECQMEHLMYLILQITSLVKLNCKVEKWIMYTKNEFGSEHIYGELIHLIDGIDAWIKYSKEYLK